ncbi:hypothetical protein SLE2022_362920 [Rubroshorea leprosula]
MPCFSCSHMASHASSMAQCPEEPCFLSSYEHIVVAKVSPHESESSYWTNSRVVKLSLLLLEPLPGPKKEIKKGLVF